MSIRIKVKQSSNCEKCDGIGYYSVSDDSKHYDKPVEYVCSNCEGTGLVWEDRNLPLSSLKDLLK